MNSFALSSPPVAGLAAAAILTAANFVANHGLRRPPPRLAYAIVVIFLAGTLNPAMALARLLEARFLSQNALALSPWALGAALALGSVFLARAMRGEPAMQYRRLPKLLIALFAPSLAEVLVFMGIVFTLAEHSLLPLSRFVVTEAVAIVVTSGLFSLYHLTHAAPWNSGRVIGILFVVWLGISLFYAATHNLWATALLNTLMATVGFVKNRVTRPEEQPLAVSLLLDLLAIACVAWLCALPA